MKRIIITIIASFAIVLGVGVTDGAEAKRFNGRGFAQIQEGTPKWKAERMLGVGRGKYSEYYTQTPMKIRKYYSSRNSWCWAEITYTKSLLGGPWRVSEKWGWNTQCGNRW